MLELAKASKSAAAAKTIAQAIHAKLRDSVGKVSQLGVQTEVEILDLDSVSTAAEVLEAPPFRERMSQQQQPNSRLSATFAYGRFERANKSRRPR